MLKIHIKSILSPTILHDYKPTFFLSKTIGPLLKINTALFFAVNSLFPARFSRFTRTLLGAFVFFIVDRHSMPTASICPDHVPGHEFAGALVVGVAAPWTTVSPRLGAFASFVTPIVEDLSELCSEGFTSNVSVEAATCPLIARNCP